MPDDILTDTQTEIYTAARVGLDVFAAPEDQPLALILRQPAQEDELLRVAVGQFDCVLGETAHNTRRICEMLEAAVEHGSRLTVFPQCAITGYNAASKQDALVNAIFLEGEEVPTIAAMCARLNTWAVVGALVQADGLAHDAALLFGPGGLAAKYDRAHTQTHGPDAFISRGHAGFAVYETPIGKIGLLIGRDLNFPEAAMALALKEAEIIAAPCAWSASDAAIPEFVVRARARETSAFVLAANRVGQERDLAYIGESCIIAPDGAGLAGASAREEHLIIADINLREARRKPFLSQRRPELYP